MTRWSDDLIDLVPRVHARLHHTSTFRRLVPSGGVLIRVSTRGGWYQRSEGELFSPEMDRHLRNIGQAERVRIGSRLAVTVIATAVSSDSFQELTWCAGEHSPRNVDWIDATPPFLEVIGVDDFGEPILED